jgi:hypothetical protein
MPDAPRPRQPTLRRRHLRHRRVPRAREVRAARRRAARTRRRRTTASPTTAATAPSSRSARAARSPSPKRCAGLIGNTSLPDRSARWASGSGGPPSNRFERDPAISPEHLHAVHELGRVGRDRATGPRASCSSPARPARRASTTTTPTYLKSLDAHAPKTRSPPNATGPCASLDTWLWINIDLKPTSPRPPASNA